MSAPIEKDLEALWPDVERIAIGMVTTNDDGTLRCRPMIASVDRDENALYFFTRAGDHKVTEVREDSRVCVSFVDSEEKIFISASGPGTILSDRDKAREHWSFATIAWFDDGIDDPDLRLLRVEVEQAERWNAETDPLRNIWEIALSYRNTKTPDLNENTKYRAASD